MVENKNYSWRSIKTALFIFLPLFIIISIILWTFYFIDVKSKKNIQLMQASNTINLQKSKIAANFKSIVADLLFFSNYSQLHELKKEFITNKDHLINDLALFSRGAKIYDQIRIINSDGMENIRINFIEGKGPVIVKDDKLQSKKERYYFQDTIILNKGEIFVSPLDLNIEYGEVEKPYKPMIRFGTPIFDENGRKYGIIIFNYLAANLIKDVTDLTEISSGQSIMYNSEGYWLINKFNPKMEWGFMFESKKDITLKIKNPDIWHKITIKDSSQFKNDEGLHTFTTIYPLIESWKSSLSTNKSFTSSQKKSTINKYFWKIGLFIPKDILMAGLEKNQANFIIFNILVFIFLSIVSIWIAGARIKVKQAAEDLHQSHIVLEDKVRARTEELFKVNSTFQSLVESTVGLVGQDFFDNLVEKLCQMLSCEYAILSKLIESDSLKMIAVKSIGESPEDFLNILPGTISDKVIKDGFCHYSENVSSLFPNDINLKKMNAVGYVGLSIKNTSGKVIGILCAISQNKFDLPAKTDSIMNVLSARAAAEIERIEKEEESNQLALKLRQAYKMEAIGTLAGGIAHDFNNILTPILGYTDILQTSFSEESNEKEYLNEILKSAERAKDLVKQILTFSRQTERERKPIKIQNIINEAIKLLRSSIPASIEIKHNIDQDCKLIFADSTQMHQIVMNLCTNAYHAMREKGGTIAVSLTEIEVSSENLLFDVQLSEGTYLKLEISDNGHGIPKEILEKVFDPYFTTKKKGEGTGMGLSIVHGIVTNHHGKISVYSEPEIGTTFNLYFPCIKRETAPVNNIKIEKKKLGGHERILAVDDEEVIVNMYKKILESYGYQVTSLTSSTEALSIFENQPDTYDLIITDMTMPHMSGIDLAKKLKAVRSDIPIILCTGFSELINKEKAKSLGINRYLMKPALNQDLLVSVRETLDSIKIKS